MSDLVGKPKYQFSHKEAQIIFQLSSNTHTISSSVIIKFPHLSLVVRKPVFGFLATSNTNRARGLKFRIYEVQGLFYPCSENKGADQLRGYHKADLRLRFRIYKKTVFSRRGSFHFWLCSIFQRKSTDFSVSSFSCRDHDLRCCGDASLTVMNASTMNGVLTTSDVWMTSV